MTPPTDPEEYIKRLRMILFEMGYRDVEIWHHENQYRPDGTPVVASFGDEVPPAVWWKSGTLMGPSPCWACYQQAQADRDVGLRCVAGNCSNPQGPAEAPRELLIKAEDYSPRQRQKDDEWWRR